MKPTTIDLGQTKPLNQGTGSSSDNKALVQVGDRIEISPMALATVEDVSVRLLKATGAALFFDYGERFSQQDSLRGYQQHKQVHVLSEPGISAHPNIEIYPTEVTRISPQA